MRSPHTDRLGEALWPIDTLLQCCVELERSRHLTTLPELHQNMRSSAEKQQAESIASMWNAMHVENLTSSWYSKGQIHLPRVGVEYVCMHVHAVLCRCH